MEINRKKIKMQEQWMRWEPVKGLSSNYYVDYILDGKDGFKIVLVDYIDDKKKMMIIFDKSVYAYKSTEESFRQQTLDMLAEQYGGKFYQEWAFFKVQNSSYLKWLSKQSYGITDSLPFMHFSILTVDSFIDIVDSYEPKIEFIDNE